MDEHWTANCFVNELKSYGKLLNESFENEKWIGVHHTIEFNKKRKEPIEIDRRVWEEHQNQIARRVTNNHLNLIRVTNFNLDSIERRVRMNLAFSGDGW